MARPELVFDANVTPLRQKMREASDDLKRFGASAGPAVDGVASSVVQLTSRFTALGAVLSLGGLAMLARQSIDAADALNDLALRTQTNVKDLASFKLISEQSGTSLESLGKGLNKLTVWMAENADAARKLGITARDPVEAFLQFVEALERAETPQDRAAIANKVLGKSYAELLPLLMEGVDKLRESAKESEAYAQQLEKLAPRADAFNDRLATMAQRWDALKVAMGTAFLDLLPNSMTMDATSARIIELQGDIGALQRQLKDSPGSGLLHRWLYGTEGDIKAKLAAAQRELEALQAKQATPAAGGQPKGGRLSFGDIEDDSKKPKGKKEKASTEEPSFIGTYDAVLAQRKNAYEEENRLRQFSKEQELAYWREIEGAYQLTSKDQLAITRRTAALELAIRRESAQQAVGLSNEAIAAGHAAALAALELDRQAAQNAEQQGALSKAELLAQEEAFAARRYEIDLQAVKAKMELAALSGDDPVAMAKLNEEKLAALRTYTASRSAIEQQEQLEQDQRIRASTDQTGGAFGQMAQNLLTRTTTLRAQLGQLWRSIYEMFMSNMVTKPFAEWVASQTRLLAMKMGFIAQEKAMDAASAKTSVSIKTAETTTVVAENAVQAATGGAASMSSIPFIGPVLALAAMAALFAAVSGMRNKSAAGGYDIPKGINPMTQLHEEEMVLPKVHANTIRRLGEQAEQPAAAPGLPPIAVTAMDSRDVLRALKEGGALHRALKDLHRSFAR